MRFINHFALCVSVCLSPLSAGKRTRIAGILERVEAVIANQRHGKHVSITTNQHARIEEMLPQQFYRV